MKTRVGLVSLILLCVTLGAVPTLAQTLYSNGMANGNTDAWTVNFGFIVSDTLCCREGSPAGTVTISGFSFAAWLFPGDSVTSAELSFTSDENGGTSYFDQTVNFTQSACTGNLFGFSVCTESTTFSPFTINNGSNLLWVNLQNASVPNGDPVYWDENSGPSMASENSVGSIPSEAFTVYGFTSASSTSTTSVPEPSSIMLLGSGLLGLAGLVRRKLM